MSKTTLHLAKKIQVQASGQKSTKIDAEISPNDFQKNQIKIYVEPW